jgi:hypothetical protein
MSHAPAGGGGAASPAVSSADATLRASFGVTFSELRARADSGVVRALGARIGALPRRRLRVLLVTNSTMKFQERLVLSFFDHAGLSACDCWIAEQAERSIVPKLENVRYVERSQAEHETYDAVVAFDCDRTLLELCAARSVPGYFIGYPRQSNHPPQRFPRLRVPIRAYVTQPRFHTRAALETWFGRHNVTYCAGIHFPPNVPIQLACPERLRFELLVPGGGDRDYERLFRIRAALPERVLVTNARSPAYLGDRRNDFGILSRDPRFVLLEWVPAERYAELLLHARVVLLPAIGLATGEYTCISDALWFGKPVLTSPVHATLALPDRVTLCEDDAAFVRQLAALRDPARHAERSRAALTIGRREHNLLELLIRLYRDL